MKTFLIFLVFLSFADFCKPQFVFNKLYNNHNRSDGGFSVTQTLDNGFISVGGSYGPGSGLFIVRTRANSDTLWQKYYNFIPQGGEDGNSVIQLNDSSFSICGTIYDSTEQASDTYLLKLSQSGQVLWKKSIDAGFNDRGIMHKQTSDGGFIIGGYYHNASNSHSQLYLIKTDNLGNVQWQKNYGDFNYYNFLYSIDLTYDGGFILGGEFQNSVTNSYDMFLLKTDSLGNQQWKNYYGSTLWESVGFSVATFDKGYIIVGAKESLDGTFDSWVVKTDSMGITQWSKVIGLTGLNDYFKYVKQLPDGSFIIGGNVKDTIHPNNRPRIQLLKLSKYGDSLWAKSYTYYGGGYQYGSGITDDYIEDLNLTSDGGFIICGYILNNYMPGQNDLLLIKTDSMGNTCQIDTITYKACSYQDCSYTQAAFTVSSDTIILQNTDTIHFYNHSTFAEHWFWNFGDNSTSTVQNPLHIFNTTGTFTVMQIAYYYNCSDTAYHTIVVKNIISSYNITGTLTYSNTSNTPLSNVKLYLKQNEIVVDSTITNTSGSYLFSSKPTGTYTISAYTSKPWSNITATDALIIDRHVAGLSILSEPKLSAADVNQSNNITGADALLVKLRVVTLIDSFLSSDWYFNPQPVTVSNADVIVNFKGICFGDVNGSYIPPVVKINNPVSQTKKK